MAEKQADVRAAPEPQPPVGQEQMVIAISLVTDSAKSGAWQVIKNVITELSQIDAVNKYILFVEREFDNSFGALPDNFQVIRTMVSATSSAQTILWHLIVLPVLAARHKADVVHLPAHNMPAFFKSRPTILTIHDLTEYRLKKHYSRLRMLYRKLSVPITAKVVDRIITVSEHSKRDVVRFLGAPEEKITRIYNAFDRRSEPPAPGGGLNILRWEYGIQPPYILYVGQIQMPNRNLVRLITAYHNLKIKHGLTHKLVLAGKRHPSSRPVFAMVKELSLDEDVIFPGYVANERLPFFYRNAELFVYVPMYEGFGIPPLEALSHGIPVVVSDTSSLPEVVGDAALKVDPHDVNDISTAMYRLLSDATLRNELIARSPGQIKKFSWRESALQYLEQYRKLNQNSAVGLPAERK